MEDVVHVDPERPDIWELLTVSVQPQEPQPLSQFVELIKSKPAVPKTWKSKAASVLIDVLATVVWLYGFLKIFVMDIDRVLMHRFAPSYAGLLDYRILACVGLILVVSVFLWRWKTLGAVAYIAGYPLVLLCWKIPKLVLKTKLYRNWFVIIAAMNGLTLAIQNIRYHLISKCTATLCVAVIFLSHCRALLIAAAAVVLMLLMLSTVQVIRQTFAASPFISALASVNYIHPSATIRFPQRLPQLNVSWV